MMPLHDSTCHHQTYLAAVRHTQIKLGLPEPCEFLSLNLPVFLQDLLTFQDLSFM